MFFRVLSFIVAVGVVSVDGGVIPDDNFDPNPHYTFAYNVDDAVTGDSKNQYETRVGDVVKGSYSLNDPDGTRRIVDYTADPVNGFNAVVRRTPQIPTILTVAALPVINNNNVDEINPEGTPKKTTVTETATSVVHNPALLRHYIPIGAYPVAYPGHVPLGLTLGPAGLFYKTVYGF